MNLLGVDVGFSKTQRSTGVACLHGDKLSLYRATSDWENRRDQLPQGFSPDMIAIDGPLLPHLIDSNRARNCEQFFSRGLFCRRCKPGLSHFGTGYDLRKAAYETAHQFGKHFFGTGYNLNSRIVEAFPNLFLGVMVSDADYLAMPKLRRGQKFDWLYGRAIEKLAVAGTLAGLPGFVCERVIVEADHELRAALVCLATAGLALNGKAVRAGCDDGGWFWLPPIELWEPWAVEAARINLDD